MNKKNYVNPLRNQCFSLIDLCSVQVQTSKDGLSHSIPAAVLKDIRRIILTGCGDSAIAALAARPVFERFVSSKGIHVVYQNSIDASRYLEHPPELTGQTLVVIISVSGMAPRLLENVRRANILGCISLAITNNIKSPLALESKYVLDTNTPKVEFDSPGLRSYYASLVSLMLLAAAIGDSHSSNHINTVEEIAGDIKKYSLSYKDELNWIDEELFGIAEAWSGLEGFELIGDGADKASNMFVSAKFAEAAGVMAAVTDSESWFHVNMFANNPQKIGTILLGSLNGNNKSRISEIITLARAIKRPVLLIADGSLRNFGLDDTFPFCRIPNLDPGLVYISTVMNFVPGSILVSYIAALRKNDYFNGGSFFDPEIIAHGIMAPDICIVK
jgi:glucosamine 6-phosphate synthetase-like amidotransferase/phosphosugar isomerase protein